MGEAPAIDRTGDRSPEGRLPDGAVLVARRAGRRVACGAVCGRLQPALIAAGDRAGGSGVVFFAHAAAVAAWRIRKT